MFENSADLYDALYVSWKDYPSQAVTLVSLIRSRVPNASTVLDVACGTGEHMLHLRELGLEVEGVEIDPAFAQIAREKNPTASIHLMDMVELSLGRTYDAVMCLFSSIGYAQTEAKLRRALDRFAAHTVQGGIVIVEPWFTPDTIVDGHVAFGTATDGDRMLCRMSRTTVRDGISTIEFEYLVGTKDGIERRSEVHELGLFSSDTMKSAMEGSGLSVEYDPEGLIGRGLFIGTKE